MGFILSTSIAGGQIPAPTTGPLDSRPLFVSLSVSKTLTLTLTLTQTLTHPPALSVGCGKRPALSLFPLRLRRAMSAALMAQGPTAAHRQVSLSLRSKNPMVGKWTQWTLFNRSRRPPLPHHVVSGFYR